MSGNQIWYEVPDTEEERAFLKWFADNEEELDKTNDEMEIISKWIKDGIEYVTVHGGSFALINHDISQEQLEKMTVIVQKHGLIIKKNGENHCITQ